MSQITKIDLRWEEREGCQLNCRDIDKVLKLPFLETGVTAHAGEYFRKTRPDKQVVIKTVDGKF